MRLLLLEVIIIKNALHVVIVMKDCFQFQNFSRKMVVLFVDHVTTEKVLNVLVVVLKLQKWIMLNRTVCIFVKKNA